MRISDWSSDVCSSDLLSCHGTLPRCRPPFQHLEGRHTEGRSLGTRRQDEGDPTDRAWAIAAFSISGTKGLDMTKAGSTRSPVSRSEERRVGKAVSVRVDLGGRRIIKQKKKQKV